MNGFWDAVVAWLRQPAWFAPPTTTRWEALNVTVLAAVLALALWAAGDAAADLAHQRREKRNGGNLIIAKNELRTESLRVARLAMWLAVFVGFALNYDRQLVLVAVVPTLYGLGEVAVLVLNRIARVRIRNYYEKAERNERARRKELEIKRRYAEAAEAVGVEELP